MYLKAKQHHFYLAVAWSGLVEFCYSEFRYCVTNLYFLEFEIWRTRSQSKWNL